MIVQALELENFRNYEELKLDFHEGINIFYGDNAQGKTNILEAVYLCSTNKSHRSSRDREMIRFDADEAHIKMFLSRRDSMYRIDMHLKKNRAKGIAINGLPIRRASELFGIANVVFFSPEDLQIIKEGPAGRRKFLDLELCQLDKIYVYNLVNYNKALNQRNLLLKELSVRPEYRDTLDIWDAQLVKFGSHLIAIRKKFMEELMPIVEEIHGRLSGGKETLVLTYEPNVRAEEFAGTLEKNRERDIRQKATQSGPHRDDIRFCVNGIDIRTYGSQGQQRTAALSLKLAEIELVKKETKDTPVLLLDDVLSELDAGRQNYLLGSIEGIQTMITCTGLDDFVTHRFHIDKIFRVKSGTVVKEN